MRPMDDREIDALLAQLAEDAEPLGQDLRSRLLADAPRPMPTPWYRRLTRRVGPAGWGGALGVPMAAACGLWLGVAQPDWVLGTVPGVTVDQQVSGAEDLFDDVYGSTWEGWL
ncbi:hypothetical protein [Jannaschia sp. AI_61]|nr:hypothetical protein [Jannaschia sp. AI_61]